MKTSGRVIAACVVLGALLSGCSGDSDELRVSDVRVGAPTGPNAAVYFTARGSGEDDALIAANTDVATRAEIHETVTSDSGTMSMQSLPRLDLPAGGQLVLEPGGYHLMLVNVEPLEVGDTISVTLTWDVAGEMTVEAEVVDPSDTMGEEASEHTEGH